MHKNGYNSKCSHKNSKLKALLTIITRKLNTYLRYPKNNEVFNQLINQGIKNIISILCQDFQTSYVWNTVYRRDTSIIPVRMKQMTPPYTNIYSDIKSVLEVSVNRTTTTKHKDMYIRIIVKIIKKIIGMCSGSFWSLQLSICHCLPP